MGKMFFNSSSFDYFKRDEPVAYMEKIPKGRTKKTKTPQPPPMQKAQEKIIKNKDGTITLQKQDKGGFNQTINIYTGRQRATGTKGKGQNTIVKPKVELFTPSGRPDFKKWELYQSSYYNQLIDDRLFGNEIDEDFVEELESITKLNMFNVFNNNNKPEA